MATGVYRSAPEDVAENRDVDLLTDIKGRLTVVLVADVLGTKLPIMGMYSPRGADDLAQDSTIGLNVNAFQYAFDGATSDRVRVISTIKNLASVSVNAEATIWTPTSGKKFRLMRLILSNSGTAGVCTFKDNTSGTTILSLYLPANGAPQQIDFGNGILSAAANNVLTATLTSGTLVGAVMGTEE